MTHRTARLILLGAVTGLLAGAPSPTPAEVVFDDHFDGNSGGVPQGWWIGHGVEEDVVEAGTIVTLYDWVSIHSESALDPSSGTVTMLTQIDGTQPDGQPHAGLSNHETFSRCGILLRADTGEIAMYAADSEGGPQVYSVGYAEGYAGGAIQTTLILDATAFRVLTDSPAFDSGWIAYATAFPTFTRDDLGSAVHVYLMDDVAQEEAGFSAFDRVAVDVDPSTPVERISWGRLKALHGD